MRTFCPYCSYKTLKLNKKSYIKFTSRVVDHVTLVIMQIVKNSCWQNEPLIQDKKGLVLPLTFTVTKKRELQE